MRHSKDRINGLADQIRRLAETNENQRRLSLFRMPHLGVDKLLPWTGEGKALPVIVQPEVSFWAGVLDFSLVDYYQDPVAYLETQLKMTLAHWKELPDDQPITKIVSIRFGVALVPSLWGARIVFS